MTNLIDGLTCQPRNAKYVILLNDNRYFTDTFTDAQTIYDRLLNSTDDNDFLKMFKHEQMPCESK